MTNAARPASEEQVERLRAFFRGHFHSNNRCSCGSADYYEHAIHLTERLLASGVVVLVDTEYVHYFNRMTRAESNLADIRKALGVRGKSQQNSLARVAELTKLAEQAAAHAGAVIHEILREHFNPLYPVASASIQEKYAEPLAALDRVIAARTEQAQREREALREHLRFWLSAFDEYCAIPETHKGTCSPESGCDGNCVDRARLAEAHSKARAALEGR